MTDAPPLAIMDTMNEKDQCVECDRDDVYLIDGEICQDCDEALYDDQF